MIFLLLTTLTVLQAEDDWIYFHYGAGASSMNLTSSDQATVNNTPPLAEYSSFSLDIGFHIPFNDNFLLGYTITTSEDFAGAGLFGFAYILEGASLVYYSNDSFNGLFYRVDIGKTYSTRYTNGGIYALESPKTSSESLGGMLGIGYQYNIFYIQLTEHLFTIDGERVTSLSGQLGFWW